MDEFFPIGGNFSKFIEKRQLTSEEKWVKKQSLLERVRNQDGKKRSDPFLLFLLF
jgi:hypothetical protein